MQNSSERLQGMQHSIHPMGSPEWKPADLSVSVRRKNGSGEPSNKMCHLIKKTKQSTGSDLKQQSCSPESEEDEQLLLLDEPGAIGNNAETYIITIEAGEDITLKIMEFSQEGPNTVCVPSANGFISNVTLLNPDGRIVKYEGHFGIISISGLYCLKDNDRSCTITGKLSITLAASNNHAFGGVVAGALVAASPLQVMVCSFHTEEFEESSEGDAVCLSSQGKENSDNKSEGVEDCALSQGNDDGNRHLDENVGSPPPQWFDGSHLDENVGSPPPHCFDGIADRVPNLSFYVYR